MQLGENTVGQIWVAAISCITALACNGVLVPVYGLKGAAISAVIANSVTLASSIFVGRRTFCLPFPFAKILGSVVSAVAMVAALLLAQRAWPGGGHVRTFALVAVGAAVYGSMSVATNAGDCRSIAEKVLGRWLRKL
jgi:O-antigen/teichoic acid export membrane protein